MNSKWIKGLNVRLKAIKLLEQNIGSKLYDIALRQNFFDMSSQARATNKQKQPSLST